MVSVNQKFGFMVSQRVHQYNLWYVLILGHHYQESSHGSTDRHIPLHCLQSKEYVNYARLKWPFLFHCSVLQYLHGTCPNSRQRIEGAWKLRVGNVLSKPHLRKRLDCI